jgi:hypothetical protein
MRRSSIRIEREDKVRGRGYRRWTKVREPLTRSRADLRNREREAQDSPVGTDNCSALLPLNPRRDRPIYAVVASLASITRSDGG